MIYIIGDLHLSFGVDKPMNIFGTVWENHTEKLEKNWKKVVKDEDTVFLAGDFSWAMKLEETLEDFKYIDKLPGKKILLKGNHDYWWSSIKKNRDFLEKNIPLVSKKLPHTGESFLVFLIIEKENPETIQLSFLLSNMPFHQHSSRSIFCRKEPEERIFLIHLL